MSTLCKARALYVKTTVIQCGVPDYHGDILDAEAVKKVFTSFNNQNRFDIHHNRIPVDDVSLLENYISKSDEEIAGTLVPRGSWNVVLRVDNPEVQRKIMEGEIQGVSLTTAIKEECRAGFTKTGNITYSELPEAECWLPVFISLVTEPANLVGLHVMDYDVYIEKSKHNYVHKFGGKTLSFLDKLKTLIAEEEASHPVIEKSTGEENKEEVTAPVDENIEEPVVEKAATDEKEDETATSDDKEEVVEEEVKEEEVVEKAEDPAAEAEVEADVEEVKEEVDLEAKIADLEARIAELEKQINKAEPTTESEPVEATTEDKKDDQPVITKSKRIEVTTESTSTSNFYELSGRDPVTGKKIRPKTKVLN